MERVYLTRNIPKAVSMLKEYFELIIHDSTKPPDRYEIVKNVSNVYAILCSPSDNIDSIVINAANKLRVISTYSVGYDHIDLASANARGIIVGYTPNVLTNATADLTFALLLAIARRVVEGDKLIRSAKWSNIYEYNFMLGRDLEGKILGIIGLGRIGAAVARRAAGFGMKIVYNSREKKNIYEYLSLDELLKVSDFVSIHTPLNEHTYHMIGEKELKSMKRCAYLINTARGKIVDERALIRALKEGWIAGAALDVYEQEPLVASELIELDNVVLTPHIGSATIETRERMAEIAALNIINPYKGLEPIYRVK
ncbi:MAG: D-glycerate dehydrogenase [Candidatus Nitrosocaldaceae archaeon]